MSRKEKKELFLDVVLDQGRSAGNEKYSMALLIDSMDKSSRIIKFLNWILVILGIVMIGISGFSLYMQYFRN
jgi:hypothetical protein